MIRPLFRSLAIAVPLVAGSAAAAQDAGWGTAPPSDDWNDPANWDPAVVPTGTATFGPSSRTRIRFLHPTPPADSQPETRIGTMRFEAGAPAYEFAVTCTAAASGICQAGERGRRLVFTGAGIDNQSANRPVFTILGVGTRGSVFETNMVEFQNASSAGDAIFRIGQATVTPAGGAGQLVFTGSSTAASASIENRWELYFRESSRAGSAQIANHWVMSLSGNASLDQATILNESGALTLLDTATAERATITNSRALLVFYDTTAGAATIVNNPGVPRGPALLPQCILITTTLGALCSDRPTLFSATIFSGASAGSANITNNAGNDESGAQPPTGIDPRFDLRNGTATIFEGNATAANATITNNGGTANVAFSLTGTGDSRVITGNNTAVTFFADTATAGNATIVNNAGGATVFLDTSNAGTATITNNAGGRLDFRDGSRGGGATIVSSGITSFHNSSLADTATITLNGGSLDFYDRSSPSSSLITINAGASVRFYDDTFGGMAHFINNAGGLIDISGTAAPGISLASIEGAGDILLGARRLLLGNSRSTEISGMISDGGAGGSLVKAGTGTLTLSGANTYTGPTTVVAGTLLVNGSVLGPITVNAGATLGGGGAVGATTIESGGTLAPGQSIGMLTVNGNLLFGPNSRFLVEVAPSAADRVNVTGTATLAGLVTAVATGGTYAFGEFTLLSAAGGITGQFDALSTQGSFGAFTASLRYDPNNVFLTLAAPIGCPGTTDTITYAGTNSGGIAVTPPDCYSRLVVRDLTHDIAPATDIDGIRFVNSTRDVAIEVTAPDRTIRVNGDFARGIHAESAGSDISVTNDAAIVTSRATIVSDPARGAHGIRVVNPAGRTSIVNSGALNVTGFQSSAIRVDAQGSGADTVTIRNSGAITLLGDDAGAIDVRMSAGSTVTIDNSGDMSLTRLNVPSADTPHGIRVVGQGPDTLVDITNSGRIGSVPSSIYVDGRAGIADAQERFVTRIVNSGDVHGFRAIYVVGGSTSVVNEGRIDRPPPAGVGLASQGAGITVGTVGVFRDEDLTGAASLNNAFRPTDLSGSAAIDIVNRGEIAFVADRNAAIRAYGYEVAVANAGSLSTTGNFAPAIYAAGINDIRVVNSGTIRTSGVLSHGVEIESLNAFAGEDDLVELVVGGSVEASGEAAFGASIFFRAGTGTYDAAGTMPIGGTGGANEGRSIVTVEAGGRLIGGSGPGGIGLVISGGRLNILDNRGTVTSLSNNGVVSGDGSELILNRGTIGAMDLAGGDDEVRLFAGGAFTGAVDGGAGTDSFRLEGEAGTSATFDFAASPLANFESYFKQGAGTWTLTGDGSGAAGPWAVDGGTLIVDGNLSNSTFTVNAGATLGGTGTVGSTTIADGGTLAPGQSIGTLTVNGNLQFDPNSRFLVEVAPSAADRVNVTGSATLAGLVTAIATGGSYAFGEFTLLSAAGGITGQFDALSTQGSFGAFTASLRYDPNNVFLTLAAPIGCPGTTDTITYAGNNSGGIAVTPPDCYRRLVVENLTHDIAPAADVDGIRFVNVTRDVAIEVTAPDRTIRVNGDFARGIHAESAGSDISIDNDAAIVTSRATTAIGAGQGAHGIFVLNPTGITHVANRGAITVRGWESSAIYLDARGAGADTAAIFNSGALTVTGNGSQGIEARISSGSTLEIDNDGDIAIFDVLGQSGDPNATEFNSGIYAVTEGPQVTIGITNRGDIVEPVRGAGASGVAGIRVLAPVNQTVLQETIVTRIVNSGDILVGSKGIHVLGGSTYVENSGRIETTQSDFRFAGEESAVIDVRVRGFTIRPDSMVLPGDLDSDARIEIVNRGALETFGDFQTWGILARGYDVRIDNSGAIATRGVFSPGMEVLALGAVDIVNSGTITATGDASTGIGVVSYNAFAGEDDRVSVDVSGSVNASGLAGIGIGISFVAGTTIGGTGGVNEGHSLVTVAAGGSVIGGASGAGVSFGGGRLNTLDNRGTVTSADGVGVIVSPGPSRELILNRGTIGSVALEGGDDEVQLFAGGSFTGAVDGGAGTDTFRLEGDAGTSGTLDLTVAPLRNFEAFAKNGAGTWTLTGSQTTGGGMFAVNAGRLLVNGDARGFGFTVQNGAILGGTGTLGDLIVAAGGTLAPGNSIGGLNAAGNVTFRAGSFYELEIAAAGGGDRLSAAGTATIEGGTVRVLTLDPETQYAGGTRYTFLSAAGGLTGTFAGLVENSAFLDFTLGYDATSAFLTINLVQTFPDVALTFNQRQASTALTGFDTQGGADGLAVYNQLLMLDAAPARSAFDLASGEIYAVTLATALRHGDALTSRLLGRAALAQAEGWGIWGGIEGDDGRAEGDGNGARFTRDGFGGELGIDRRGAGNRWAAGLSAGWQWTGIRLDPRASRAEGDHWHVGGYARYGTGGAGLTAALSLAHLSGEAEVTRTVAFGTLARTATARVELDATALGGDLRFGLPLGGGLAAGPAARIVHVRGGLDRFAETGAASLDLSGRAGNDDDRTRYGAGAFLNWQSARGAIDIAATYESGGASPTEIGLVMTGAPNSPYRVRAARGDGDAGRFALSGHYDLGGGWTVGGQAEATIGSRERSLRGNARIGYRF